MDLALDNLQRFICHKTNEPTFTDINGTQCHSLYYLIQNIHNMVHLSASLQGVKSYSQHMTVNHLMVRNMEYPLLLVPLWTGVVAPDRVLSMGQIELFDI